MVKKKTFWKIALALVVLYAAVKLIQPSPYHPDRTPKMNDIPPKIAALFEKTRPVCFGRFMIDLPVNAEVVWGPLALPYTTKVYPDGGLMLRAQIKETVDKITSDEHGDEPSMLIGVFDSVNEDSKIVMGYESSSHTSSVNIYSYIRLGNTAFVQEGLGLSLRIGSKLSNPTHAELIEENVEEFRNFARHFRLRAENEIPDEQGVCIEEGFVSFSLDYTTERVAVGFRFPEYPDVTFSVSTRNTSKPRDDETLDAYLKRGQGWAGEMGLGELYKKITTFRKGDRAIGQWEGAEILGRMPSRVGGPSTHEFVFKTPGAVGSDLLRPVATIQFYTGVKNNETGSVKPSLTDDEAIAMWDKLTSTIRVRPVKEKPSGGKPEPENTPPAPEHGAKAPDAFPRKLATGETCPKTGPWRCVEDGNTLNFTEGQRMPTAYFYKPATGLLDRIKGVKEVFSHTGPGHWEWVGEEKNG